VASSPHYHAGNIRARFTIAPVARMPIRGGKVSGVLMVTLAPHYHASRQPERGVLTPPVQVQALFGGTEVTDSGSGLSG